jgi:hypothetical protein
MVVRELIEQLEQLPSDAHVDAMFPTGSEAFAVTGVDQVQLNDGRVIAIVDITDGPALKGVA